MELKHFYYYSELVAIVVPVVILFSRGKYFLVCSP